MQGLRFSEEELGEAINVLLWAKSHIKDSEGEITCGDAKACWSKQTSEVELWVEGAYGLSEGELK